MFPYRFISMPMVIIAVALVILNIILFFKIWRMCNDIHRITSHLCGNKFEVNNENNDGSTSITANSVTSGYELNEELEAELRKIAKNSRGVVEDDYKKRFGFMPEEHLKETINKAKSIYAASNIGMPEKFTKIKTMEDLWNLYE